MGGIVEECGAHLSNKCADETTSYPTREAAGERCRRSFGHILAGAGKHPSGHTLAGAP